MIAGIPVTMENNNASMPRMRLVNAVRSGRSRKYPGIPCCESDDGTCTAFSGARPQFGHEAAPSASFAPHPVQNISTQPHPIAASMVSEPEILVVRNQSEDTVDAVDEEQR